VVTLEKSPHRFGLQVAGRSTGDEDERRASARRGMVVKMHRSLLRGR
jgi:hypothetical protein